MSGQPSANTYNESSASAQLALEQAFLLKIYPYLYEKNMVPYIPKNLILSILNAETPEYGDMGFLNKLTYVKGAFDFMELTPDQMGQLVPQIRIFKQIYKDGQPTTEIEFEVPDKINPDILSDTTDQGLGIKNFQYRYVGSNPATVRNDIEAKLTLYFQNFSELLRPRTAPDNTTYAFVDLFSRSRKLIDGEVDPPPPDPPSGAEYQLTGGVLTQEAKEYRDVVGNLSSPPDKDQYLGPIEYEIKVVVGWAVPPGLSTLTSKQKEAIEESSQAFFLTLIDHEFDFGQDGTFTLELNYRARLGAILESPQLDILRLDKLNTDNPYTTTEDWLSDSGMSKIFEGSITEIVTQIKKDLKSAIYSCDKEAEEFLRGRLARLMDNIRGARYAKIGNYMVGKERLYSEWVEASTLNAWANSPAVPAEFGKSGRGTRDPYDPGAHSGGTGQEEVDGDIVNNIDASMSQLAKDTGDTAPDGRKQAWEELKETPKETKLGDSGLHGVTITYFLFGDLLDYVVGEAITGTEDQEGVTTEDLERLKLIVGSCFFGEGLYPISNIPISWDTFRSFWNKKVIQPRREKYPLLQFIRDVMRDLLFGALNGQYYSLKPGKKQVFKSAFVSLPSAGEDREDPLVAASFAQGLRGYDLVFSAFTEDNPLALMNSRGTSSDMYHYMCIFVDSGGKGPFTYEAVSNSGMGRRAYNRKMLNIHHFGFGEDSGILKEANFSKTDQPYLRESRYLEKGGDPWVQLSNVYNVDITAYGAPFFYPGQFLWISPFGLSKSRNVSYRLGSPDASPPDSNGAGSFSNLMGLGGYHIIIEVAGIFEDGLYEIKIKSRYDNSGGDLGDRAGYGSDNTKRCEDK